MTGNAHALPRIRTRRKRRRPPSGEFWWTLGWVLFNGAVTVFDLARVALGHPIVLVGAGVNAALVAFWWPMFMREWQRWMDGE